MRAKHSLLDLAVVRQRRACGGAVGAAAGCAGMPYEAPRADAAPTTQTLKKLPRKQGERVAVTIYEFRSSVNEVNGRAATDMFKTALVQSGQFRVVQRARLNEGVIH